MAEMLTGVAIGSLIAVLCIAVRLLCVDGCVDV